MSEEAAMTRTCDCGVGLMALAAGEGGKDRNGCDETSGGTGEMEELVEH